MNKYKTHILSAIFSALFVFWACKHQLPEPITGGAQIPGQTGRECDTDSVYFANQVLPLIKSSCSMPNQDCHDAITKEQELLLTSYNTISKIVVPGNANSSELIKEILKTGKERMPPPPNPAMSASDLALLKKWINQGAQNNACDQCDTLNYKFNANILPLLSLKCKGCHNPASLGGGIDLSTYSGTKIVADNGKLLGSLNWTAGFKPMPQGSIKMPACEILQIKKWIDSGALNN